MLAAAAVDGVVNAAAATPLQLLSRSLLLCLLLHLLGLRFGLLSLPLLLLLCSPLLRSLLWLSLMLPRSRLLCSRCWRARCCTCTCCNSSNRCRRAGQRLLLYQPLGYCSGPRHVRTKGVIRSDACFWTLVEYVYSDRVHFIKVFPPLFVSVVGAKEVESQSIARLRSLSIVTGTSPSGKVWGKAEADTFGRVLFPRTQQASDERFHPIRVGLRNVLYPRRPPLFCGGACSMRVFRER